jgi:hypothetical protein
MAFAYVVAFPFTFNYFMSLLGPVKDGVELTQIVTMEFYLDFSTRFLLGFGVVFELPLFIAFLVLANIVTPKQLLRFGRWATVLSFIVGAIASRSSRSTSCRSPSRTSSSRARSTTKKQRPRPPTRNAGPPSRKGDVRRMAHPLSRALIGC